MLHAWTADAEQRTSIYTLRTVEGRCPCISQEIMQVGDREKQLATGLLLKHARTHTIICIVFYNPCNRMFQYNTSKSPHSSVLPHGVETTIQSDSRMDTTSHRKEVIVLSPLKDQNRLTTVCVQFVLVGCQAENKVFSRSRRLHQTFSVKCVNSHFLCLRSCLNSWDPFSSVHGAFRVPQTHYPV